MKYKDINHILSWYYGMLKVLGQDLLCFYLKERLLSVREILESLLAPNWVFLSRGECWKGLTFFLRDSILFKIAFQCHLKSYPPDHPEWLIFHYFCVTCVTCCSPHFRRHWIHQWVHIKSTWRVNTQILKQ